MKPKIFAGLLIVLFLVVFTNPLVLHKDNNTENLLTAKVSEFSIILKRIRTIIEGCKLCDTTPSCTTSPCFPGVFCRDSTNGPICDPCPPEYKGDGKQCIKVNCNDSPCQPGVQCVPTESPPFYRCEGCPPGFIKIVNNSNDAVMFDDWDVRYMEVGVAEELQFKVTERIHCIRKQERCPDGTVCDGEAACYRLDNSDHYRCNCKIGWVGNGVICGIDSDVDGFPDVQLNCSERQCTKDNCPLVTNTDQSDLDQDSIGDSCDDDIDGDYIPNEQDNCPLVFNPFQDDEDKDGIGDLCESNIDNDYVPNYYEHCLENNPNGNQTDSDDDELIDICDNCPNAYNPDQADKDMDGVGDICDSSTD